MGNPRSRAVLTLIAAGVFALSPYLLQGRSSVQAAPMEALDGPGGESLEPLPPQAQPPNVVRLSSAEQLGKDIFYDSTLSSPTGYACATCHAPGSGFTGPDSDMNLLQGPVTGIVPGRSGFRKPQAVTYAAFSPDGPYYDDDLEVWLGGNFWDGRVTNTVGQARMPFVNPNEMNNIPVGPYPPHAGGFSPLVSQKLKLRPYSALFGLVFGRNTLSSSTDAEIYEMAVSAIAAYEASAEIVQFSSKYDATQFGVPASNTYRLSPSEENGRTLFFGAAQCSACHSSATLAPVLAATQGKDAFTMYCFANIGVPKNPNNPFYTQTNRLTNPNGCNPQGTSFIDFGLGSNPNPAPDGTTFMTSTPGDIAAFRGLFKAPSVRNVDMRPSADFVKSYMHNGVFKSLHEVVRFYNKRNVAVNLRGDQVAFDLRVGPPAGYVRLFAAPEVLDNVQNVAGVSPAAATGDVATNGQVGNLGLTQSEEIDVVNFLKTLTDGYTRPKPAVTP